MSSKNADVKRALQEVNRKASNKYRLEHVRGNQDRTKRIKDLSLGAQLNVECESRATETVKESTTKNLKEENQKLPLESVCGVCCGEETHL